MASVTSQMFKLTTVAVVHDGYPVALPVNYKVTRFDGNPVIAIRTRPGNVLDHVDEHVGFEIDGVDPGHDAGWSVLVRGTMLGVVPQERLDARPLVADGRDAWRVIAITNITGRRVAQNPLRWAFHPAGYL
jgi:Pyridoxamine 5'-phosphate oxidase